MPKNIYSVKFENRPIEDSIKLFKVALDTKVPFIHSENKDEETFIQEAYILNDKRKETAIELSPYLKDLNETTVAERFNQAKYILSELAKAQGKEKEFMRLIDNYEELSANDFEEFYDDYADGLDENKIKEILTNSESLEASVEDERYEYHEKTIEHNEKCKFVTDKEIENEAFKNVIASLDFDKKDIDKMIYTINSSNNSKSTMINEFNKLMEKHMNGIPEAERNESRLFDEYNKFFSVYDIYMKPLLKQEFGNVIKEYANTSNFKNFAVKLTNPAAISESLKGNVEDHLNRMDLPSIDKNIEFQNAIKNIKRLEYVHSKRSIFTRIVDYFKSNGENATINNLKRQIEEKGFTKQEIKSALNNADPHASLESDIEYTVDSLVSRINKGTDKHFSEYNYVINAADDKLTQSRNERIEKLEQEFLANKESDSMSVEENQTRSRVDFEEFEIEDEVESENNKSFDDMSLNDSMENDLNDSF